MRVVVAALLLLQQPAPEKPEKKDISAREVFSQAKAAAKKWQSDAVLQQLGFKPSDGEAGRAAKWEFVFASRAGTEMGQIRTRTVAVRIEPGKKPETAIGDKDAVVDPPWAGTLGDEWMDTTAVMKALEKAGVKVAAAVQQVDLVHECGRLFWRAQAGDELIALDPKNGAVIARGKQLKRRDLMAGQGMRLADFETVVRAELARWKAAPETELREIRGTAHDAKAFCATAKLDEADLNVVVGKERLCVVQVAGGQAYWLAATPYRASGRPTTADPKAVSPERLKSTMARHAPLTRWLETAKEGKAMVQMSGAMEVRFTFEAPGSQVLSFTLDLATGGISQ